ncbi:MAG: hypothetical protein PHF86_07350 [Candidatus Nanoarchaeia archaeon]|jgi:hypothetical protein|nr:hypothetical protein [Candidatus Nanoarchaeia archaeon]
MAYNEISDLILKTAYVLDPSIHLCSAKYPKDLGSWGLDETKLEELKRHLSKLTVELKVYDLNEEEFPKFKGQSLVEIEINSSTSSSKKAMDVLKRLKAFPLEKYHISNFKRKPKQEEEFLNNNTINEEE